MGILDDKVCEPIAGRFSRWNEFMENNVDFIMEDSAIHTRSHCRRVMLLAMIIGYESKMKPEQLDVLGAAAAFHDSRRASDMLDTGHGKRAADYYRAFCKNDAKLTFDERVYAVVAYHDQKDSAGIAACKKVSPDCPDLYLVFKDADGLDRLRLGSKALDPDQLRTKQAVELIPFAEKLLRASKS